MDKENFNQLLAMAKNGDDTAFERLVNEARPLLVNLSKRFSNNSKIEFDDAYSIALFGLYKTVKNFDQRNPSFFHQAKLIIMRDLINEMRFLDAKKRSVDFSNVELETIEQQGNLEDLVCSRESLNSLNKYIDSNLTDENKRIIKLYMRGYSNKEISEQIQIPVKRVALSLFRSKSKIKNYFNG